MTDEIRADYDAIEQVASKFGGQSQAVEELRKRIQNSYEPLASGDWMGKGSEAFFAEMQGIIFPAFDRLIAALEDAARVSKDCGQTLHQAEEEASGLFRF